MTLNRVLSLITSLKICLDDVFAGRYAVADIERELQCHALTLRRGDLSTSVIDDTRRKLHELNIKKSLLQWFLTHTEQPSYALLANWFQSADCSLEDKTVYAVCSLYQSLKTQFSSQFNPFHVLALGELDFDNPERFCAFLIWMLEGDASVTAILDSGLLHLFFAFQFPYFAQDNNPLHVVYRILNQLGDTPSIKNLLNDANHHYSGVRGAKLNSKASSTTLWESSNLTGGEFKHRRRLTAGTKLFQALPAPRFSDNTDDMVNLYQWFGIGMLKFFDMTCSSNRDAFKSLLLSKEGDAIQQALPALMLSGEIPLHKARLWLSSIADEVNRETISLEKWIVAQPFYVYVFSRNVIAINGINRSLIQTSIQSLLQSIEKAPLNSPAVILLVDLYVRLKADRHLSELLLLLNQFILTQVMRYTCRLPDEVYNAVRMVNIDERYVIDRVTLFRESLLEAFDREMIEPLQFKWQENRVQLYNLLDICPELCARSQYPFDSYQLKAFYIEQMWRVTTESFDLSAVLKMVASQDVDESLNLTKRILLETLLFTKANPLQTILIQYLEEAQVQWMREKFGDDKGPLEKSICADNQALAKRLLCHADALDQEDVSRSLVHATMHAQWDIVAPLLTIKGDNQPSQKSVRDAFPRLAACGKFDLLMYLLEHAKGNLFNHPEIISAGLTSAASVGQLEVVKHLLGVLVYNQYKNMVIQNTICKAAKNGHLSVVTYLLSLGNDDTLICRWVSAALSDAAYGGQLDTVIYLLGLGDVIKPSLQSISASLSCAAASGSWDVVVYLAALTGQVTFQVKHVRSALFHAAVAEQWPIFIRLLYLIHDQEVTNRIMLRVSKSLEMHTLINFTDYMTRLLEVNEVNIAQASVISTGEDAGTSENSRMSI